MTPTITIKFKITKSHCSNSKTEVDNTEHYFSPKFSGNIHSLIKNSRNTFQFQPSLYLIKCDFVTHHYTKLLQKHSMWNKLGGLGAKFSKMHPKFSNWVWNRNPHIDIPKMAKKHLKIFEHPHIPSNSEYTPDYHQTKSIACTMCKSILLNYITVI